MSEIEDTPQFRRAVEAGEAVFLCDDVMIPEAADHFKEALKAALDKLTDDTCPTCKGEGHMPWFEGYRGCPDCTNGKVEPLFIKNSGWRVKSAPGLDDDGELEIGGKGLLIQAPNGRHYSVIAPDIVKER